MTTQIINLLAETLPVTVTDHGRGRPYLLFHGGAGPGSMVGLAAALATTDRAVMPIHPGFDGTPRPEWCNSVSGLATAYLALLEQLDLHQVVAVGNSMGGWLAAELALRASPRLAAIILINAVGLDPTPASGPISDITHLAPGELMAAIFHNPAHLASPPPSLEAQAVQKANQAALHVYGGELLTHDLSLRSRLDKLTQPTLVLWGESDHIVRPTYGRQFADLIPDARYELIPQAGHLPQLEQLAAVVGCIREFEKTTDLTAHPPTFRLHFGGEA